MEPSSGSVYNKYDKVNWNLNMDPYCGERAPIIGIVKVVENRVLSYDDNYNIKIRNIKVYKNRRYHFPCCVDRYIT
jgi:hypothetical protein